MGAKRGSFAEFAPGRISRVPFPEICAVVDLFTYSIRKKLGRISQRKEKKRAYLENLQVDFLEDFAVAICWSGGGHGWNAGSRSITAIHMLKENWYPTHSLHDDCEAGK
jgi:hypothetical protein